MIDRKCQPAGLRVYARAIRVWLFMIVAEIIHGILRAIVLVPWLGEFRSNQIGVFTGSLIILGIALFSIRWIGASARHQQLIVGTIWLTLTVAFEMIFGRFVLDLSWERLLGDYNVFAGGLMPLGLLVLLMSPWIAARMQARSGTAGS